MRSPQSLTQRLVPALAVTLVATLLFGAVVVTADVATDQAPALPATFGVASPMQGDAWRYNLTLRGGWTFGLEDGLAVDQAVPFGTFQWAGVAQVRGPDGRLHDANRFHAEHLAYRPSYLQLQSESDGDVVSASTNPDEPSSELVAAEEPYWINSTSSAWTLAGTSTVLSRGWHFTDNETYTNYGVGVPGGPSLMPSYEKFFNEVGRTTFPEEEVPCLAFNPLQGANVSLDAPLAVLPACTLGGSLVTFPEGLVLRAAAIENRSGVQTVRFDGNLNGTYQAWFTPAVPYPVRVEASLPNLRPKVLEEGDLDLPGPRSFVLEMTGFAPGDAPLDLVDDPADANPVAPFVLDAPLMVGATRVGPSEASIEHPFSLGDAFQAALDSPVFNDIDTYLAGHPLAYVAAAEYREGRYVSYNPTSQLSTYDRVWSIGMTDGQETFSFQATQQSFDGWFPTSARNDTVPEPALSFQRDYGPSGPWQSAPYPSRLPSTMPTVLSLAQRWAGFDGGDLAANSWGFAIACEPVEEDPDADCRMQTTYVVGHQRQVYGGTSPGGIGAFGPLAVPGNPYGTEETIDIRREVTFDGSGRASDVLIQDHRHYKAAVDGAIPTPVLPPIDATRDPGYSVQSSAVTGIPPSYVNWIPEPKQAAQVTFLGVVVGFLYWIWPKLGVVGLFSRLHHSELLDHPARAKLVQIIEAQPGIHFHDLAQKAELANGTAVHHLRKLSDSGHVNVRRSGRYTCYFPTGRVDPTQAAAAPLLKSEGAKQVLDAVRTKPGMSNLELAQATGLQPSTVNYHVQRLANAGLVAPLRDGRNVRLHPGARAGAFDAVGAA